MQNDNHNEIMRSLGAMDGKLDGITRRLDVANGRLNEHDTEIENLNLWRANLKGMIAVITALIGTAISIAVIAVKSLWDK